MASAGSKFRTPPPCTRWRSPVPAAARSAASRGARCHEWRRRGRGRRPVGARRPAAVPERRVLTAAMPSMGAAGPRQGRAALLLAVTVGLARAVPATARDIPGTEEAHAGVVNFVHAFQDLSPSLELRELADVHAARVDVRAGIQAVAWGRLDGPPPTDVVNPRDYHDPFVRDPEDAKIGVLALAVGGPLPDAAPPRVAGLGLSLVWVPLPVPSRLARPDERWFPRPPHPRSGRRRRSPERARRRRRLGAVPRHRTGDRAGRGLRSALRLRGFAVDPATGEATLALASETLLRQALDRIHMTDVDAAVTVGDVALRAEATWFVDRPHPCASRSTRFAPAAIARLPTRCIVHQLVRRRTAEVPLAPPFVLRDAVQWGVGADTAVAGAFALLQLNQIAFLEPTPTLMVGDPTRGSPRRCAGAWSASAWTSSCAAWRCWRRAGGSPSPASRGARTTTCACGSAISCRAARAPRSSGSSAATTRSCSRRATRSDRVPHGAGATGDCTASLRPARYAAEIDDPRGCSLRGADHRRRGWAAEDTPWTTSSCAASGPAFRAWSRSSTRSARTRASTPAS